MTAPHPQTWLKTTPQGLYCVPGDFYIDPVRAVARAVITHGHSDHARPGHAHVLATAETLAIMRTRMGAERAGGQQQALGYHQRLMVGDVAVTLIPAGHVLGAAQVVMEFGGSAGSGLGRLQAPAGPDLRAFRARCLRCVRDRGDVRAAGLPASGCAAMRSGGCWPAWRCFRSARMSIGAYALGKCQRLIATCCANAARMRRSICMARMLPVCETYRALGVDLGDLRPATVAAKADLRGAIVLAPPSAIADRWARRLEDPVVCMASGWMRVRQRAKAGGVELPLIISDHADWDDLLRTIARRARRKSG